MDSSFKNNLCFLISEEKFSQKFKSDVDELDKAIISMGNFLNSELKKVIGFCTNRVISKKFDRIFKTLNKNLELPLALVMWECNHIILKVIILNELVCDVHQLRIKHPKEKFFRL